jgi:hypothetical protein
MKKLVLLIFSLFIVEQGISQIQYSNQSPINFIENLSGPRVGFTVITNGEITETLNDEFGVNANFITQFGYQFEKQVMGNEDVAGLVEGVDSSL